ncbi:tyrosine-type recombinase/integrase [Lentzea nigeriaca]|uniref:tyrosine-type recombinase/integrase n=1 Tax=Lentzea nigeriaca TaxID=1128665 RepID=UPI00195C90E1|nr:site-specific integrase [Lentzea nigeriaca]MBM7860427.1 integrase [Lentzea nigeriaca]
MASVEDRWYRDKRDDEGNVIVDANGNPEKEPTERHGIGKRWLVRWRDPDKKPRKLSFDKKVQANAHKAQVEADMSRGTYIDPTAGAVTFGTYAAEWLARQTTDPLTVENVTDRLRRYVEGTALHKTPLNRVRPGVVQSWISGLPENLDGSTKGTVFAHVSAILNAAVADELIGRNPCKSSSVRRPKGDAKEIEPWSAEWVEGLHAALPENYRILATLGAGLGLRQGEMFGLSPDDVDFLRGWVTVQRQVKLVGSKQVFSLPKGRKTRKIPLPSTVREELAAHLAARPAKDVTLPWETSTGKPTTVRLIVTTRQSGACRRTTFNSETWKPALAKAKIPTDDRENGCHALRHFFAATLLDAGENIKAVSRWLGHSSGAFTLRYYGHLMPSSEERTRSAVDAVLSRWCAPVVPQGEAQPV